MEWYDVRDSLKSLYDSSSNIWNGRTEGCPFTAGKNFISGATDILDEYFIGKEDQIHNIYNAIREGNYSNNLVSCIDLPVVFAKYMEYYAGMVDFVKAAMSVNDEDDMNLSVAEMRLDNILEKDNSFVDKLFFSEDSGEEMSINDAMKNVEMISDLIDFEGKANTQIGELMSMPMSKTYASVNKSGIGLYMQSVCTFVMDMVIKIAYTYHCICVSMATVAKSNFIHKKETPEYQIF